MVYHLISLIYLIESLNLFYFLKLWDLNFQMMCRTLSSILYLHFWKYNNPGLKFDIFWFFRWVYHLIPLKYLSESIKWFYFLRVWNLILQIPRLMLLYDHWLSFHTSVCNSFSISHENVISEWYFSKSGIFLGGVYDYLSNFFP